MAIEEQVKEDEQVVSEGLGVEASQDADSAASTPSTDVSGSTFLGEGQAQQAPASGATSAQGRKGSGMGGRLTNLRKFVEASTRSGSGGQMAKGIQKGITDIGEKTQKQTADTAKAIQQKATSEKERFEKGRQ